MIEKESSWSTEKVLILQLYMWQVKSLGEGSMCIRCRFSQKKRWFYHVVLLTTKNSSSASLLFQLLTSMLKKCHLPTNGSILPQRQRSGAQGNEKCKFPIGDDVFAQSWNLCKARVGTTSLNFLPKISILFIQSNLNSLVQLHSIVTKFWEPLLFIYKIIFEYHLCKCGYEIHIFHYASQYLHKFPCLRVANFTWHYWPILIHRLQKSIQRIQSVDSIAWGHIVELLQASA